MKSININIDDSVCWLCGKKFIQNQKTKHHTIPVAFKPVNNITVPMHHKCHDSLHDEDLAQLKRFIGHIIKTHDNVEKEIKVLTSKIEKLNKKKVSK